MRPFNFLRVKHKYAQFHLWVVPFFVFVPVFFASILGLNEQTKLLIGSLKSEVDLLKLILPFAITSLAVISTFVGPKTIDQPFKMSSRVTMLVAKAGAIEKVDVTPRHYMALLFSYLTMISIAAITFHSISEPISPFLSKPIEYFVAAVILYVYAQVLVLVCVAVYLLGDYLARQRTP